MKEQSVEEVYNEYGNMTSGGYRRGGRAGAGFLPSSSNTLWVNDRPALDRPELGLQPFETADAQTHKLDWSSRPSGRRVFAIGCATQPFTNSKWRDAVFQDVSILITAFRCARRQLHAMEFSKAS